MTKVKDEQKSEQLNVLHDAKSHCLSIITNIDLRTYLEIVDVAYTNDGALEGQRKAQTSKSAVRIRHQMMTDFLEGGVLPPVVIGVVEPKLNLDLTRVDKDQLILFLLDVKDCICIIDGMQRTTAMKEAVSANAGDDIQNRQIRIEVWVAMSVTKLIYRMLVLNTGQLPWSLRRQLEVVMLPIRKELSDSIGGLTLMESNDSGRRTRPGEFQADKILELFLIFGARSEKADTRDFISEEFLKLDFIESASKSELLSDYIAIFKVLVSLDVVLARLKPLGAERRFDKGLDLFSSQPLVAGLICALAQKIYGRPGADYETARQRNNFRKIVSDFESFVRHLSGLDEEKLEKFMRLDTLNSLLGNKTSVSTKIGDMERAYFRDAFSVLVSEGFDVKDMEICWRA
ncbi:hypothetical protein [Pseudomonas sp. UBA7721]|uniref:hypothetical protein n=1 Tax=Pseudomonas sp. UBA7721 TaxID=1947343 RepID=UPI00257DC00A|nr:hypothetical protein [Pseudomonas sp. UBA7721]